MRTGPIRIFRSPRARTALAAATAIITALSVQGCGDTKNTIIRVTPPPPSATALLLSFYRVPSASMEPSLQIGATVYTEPVGSSTLRVGEIVVFHPPVDAGQQICGPTPHQVHEGGEACAHPEAQSSDVKFIKRIVAGPGDVISIVEGHVIQNGTRQADSYTRPCRAQAPECNFPVPIRIFPDHWFLLGDNRGESDDSRFWGPVPTSWIVGVAKWCSAIGTTCRS